MMKKTMLYLLLLLSVLLLAACQKQPQPEIKLPELQAAASPAQPEPETAEQTLTLGLIDFEADKELLRGLIQSYNASGAPVRIEIVNYADGAESYADAVTRRTTELMAGNVPDLLDCSDLSGAQYAGYAKNGILLPLDGMPEEGVLSGVQQPCEVDGKRYSIVGAFTLDPLFGPASKLGASLQTSVEDVLRGAVPDVRFVWGGRDLLGVYVATLFDYVNPVDNERCDADHSALYDFLAEGKADDRLHIEPAGAAREDLLAACTETAHWEVEGGTDTTILHITPEHGQELRLVYRFGEN